MKAAILAAILIPGMAAASPWTLRDGRSFDAELAAADGLRATFTVAGKPPAVIPFADLTPASRETVRKWREDWSKPLVLPTRLAPWPAEVTVAKEEPKFKTTPDGGFEYKSPHFLIRSDLKLPAHAAADIIRALEATRAAMIAVPLGFHAGGEREFYQIRMFRDAEGYSRAGGLGGSGGYYDPRSETTLVLLPNFGIEEKDGVLRADYARNLFILRHEICHHLLDRWQRRLPMWLNEGIAEFFAALPYSQGRYTLRNPSAGLKDYVLKWRPDKNDSAITLVPPSQLMPMSKRDWDDALRKLNAYDLYNSACVLTCYLIQKNGGAPLAGYIDALRRGVNPAEAEASILLGGKPRESLNEEVSAFCTKLGIHQAGP